MPVRVRGWFRVNATTQWKAHRDAEGGGVKAGHPAAHALKEPSANVRGPRVTARRERRCMWRSSSRVTFCTGPGPLLWVQSELLRDSTQMARAEGSFCGLAVLDGDDDAAADDDGNY